MKVIIANCPACGGRYDGEITTGILTCEYCGAKFALDSDEREMLDYSDEGNYEEEEEEEEIQSMDEFASEACERFLSMVGTDDFKRSDTLERKVGVEDFETVLICHDDTIFKTGKNGFVVTDYGLYCLEMGESEPNYMHWGTLCECHKPYIEGSYVVVDGMKVAYYTGNDSVRDEICSLYRKLRKHARKLDWSE